VNATPLERQPLRASLILLAAAALYTVALFQAVGAQGGWKPPAFLQSWLDDPQARLWVWDQLTHTLTVLLLSLPFAWALTRLYTRRVLPASLLLVAPAVAWMVLDYLSLRDMLPDAPLVTTIYFVDTAKVALMLPLLAMLLRQRPRA
jgi:hypothetical protein